MNCEITVATEKQLQESASQELAYYKTAQPHQYSEEDLENIEISGFPTVDDLAIFHCL